MPLVAGTRLGPYEILGLIGAGGMGEVYKARDTRLDRSVAIKILPTELSADPERRARFEREARTIGALSHPNIVAIHDVGTVEAVTYLVMELLEGETLRARLQHSRPAPTPPPGSADAGTGSGAVRPPGGMPIRKALDIAAQVAQGLAAAHAKGIVHRDLKPENIFLTTDGRVKVLDFGLARAVATGMAAAETRTATAPAAVAGTGPGVVLGTVGYMAPEQVRGHASDHRADIFAFGAVLFEMLSGGAVQEVAACGGVLTPGNWGADGSILFVPNYFGPLVRVPAIGGPVTAVLPGSGTSLSCYSPVWLPDGTHFLVVKFFYSPAPGDDPGIYVGAIGSKELLPLVAGRVEAVTVSGDSLFFLRDRMLMTQPIDPHTRTLTGQPRVLANGVIAFSAGSGTVAYYDPADGFSLGHRVAWFRRDGTLASYSGPPGTYRDPRISPDQLSLAIGQLDAEGLSRVWVYDIARDIGLPLTAASSVGPVWSPDSTSVIAWDGDTGAKRWGVSGVPSGEPVAGLRGERPVTPYDWSPDGSWLLAGLAGGLQAVPLTGARTPVPVALPPFAGTRGDFSPDGRWVAFESAASGSRRVYVTPFPGPGERHAAASIDGVNPRWRQDGREFFFLGAQDRMVYSVAVTPRGSRLDLGQPRPLFKLPALGLNWHYDVTADGQRFVAVIEGEPDPTPLKVFVNLR